VFVAPWTWAPTATQLVVPAHTTFLRYDDAPDGLGLATCVHAPALQRQIETFGGAAPTPQHVVAVGHVTPSKVVFGAAGKNSIFHELPFHRSERTPACPLPECDPIKRQSFAARHETELSWMSVAGGIGIGTIDQCDPSHRSTKPFVPPTPWTAYHPTTKHVVVAGQETEFTMLTEFAGCGAGTIDQALPLKCKNRRDS
jgi:hypothetical protein